MALTLEIITPGEKVYCETVSAVSIPTAAGCIGILPGHIPLMGIVVIGELHIKKQQQHERLMVDKGFYRVRGDKVSILTEAAINVEAIDPQALAQAIEKAQKACEEAKQLPDINQDEVDRLDAMVQFLHAQRKKKTAVR